MQHFTATVTKDAQVTTIKDGRKVVNFDVALYGYYKTKSGEPKRTTEYYHCSYWIGIGIAALLKKGTLVELFGRVSASAYMGNDRKPKAALQMHASVIDIKSFKKADEAAAAAATAAENTAASNQEKDDLPF